MGSMVLGFKTYSIPRNPSVLSAGVMCLDFHPQQAHLLAVGCYDGSVLVYDLRSRVQPVTPSYRI